MKIWLISVLILTVFVVFGIWMQSYLEYTSQILERDIAQIETMINKREWTRADSQLKSFIKKWENLKKTWSMWTHHQELDFLEESLAKTVAAVSNHSYSEALIELGSLKHFLSHIPAREKLNITNIL